MYSMPKYNELRKQFGNFASWAIWDKNKEYDTEIIDKNIKILHSNFVFVGLNPSKNLRKVKWSNFRGGKHDRKLKYACEIDCLRGSYLTDLFKNFTKKSSSELKKEIDKKNKNFIKKVFKDFQSELDKICFNPQKGKIILLGDTVQKFFKKHFKLNDNDPLKKCILNYKHYGCWGTDKDWVEGLWDKLVIKYKVNSFENIKKLYK
ncbi:MAG: hypothetical protein A2X61_13540 [Ignavibacteria bacterium GWB2_35_12]|nr:MAG: hypothetical protein A2X63_02990 [Ignavibacteria bacterium GWA2_35_8]OGU39880.1 MAG: hypothetical protein A2X61_13540 [Ignavibacteria bacterium GWB2_35_12]OGU94429.1 MAG: hypothetical protein A2220_05540 [Ignavibacteria bacterium RIFOXYA2_FULL_35_10]OGV21625.1 MAG: hypothetical protein A2475_13945 [Ignavibacteria bacterium RIFOXYC2_FULL_35_21]